MSEIRKKLSNVQQALKAPKDKKNDFAHFVYRNAEGILEAVKPLLEKEGLLLTLSDEVVNIGDANYVKATALLQTTDDKNMEVVVTAYAREEVSLKGQIAAQITGGCSSYARKYAMCGLFNIDDSSNDIDARDNSQHVSEPKQLTGDASPQQKNLIMKLLKDKRAVETQDMVQYLENEFGIVEGTTMTKQDASNIIKELMEN
jgi:hypothetical protein